MRYKLTIEYDGTHFNGWQIQPKLRTVQGDIEAALAIIYQKPIRVYGSGRTDTGVHARNQIAHIDIDDSVPLDKLLKSLNHITNNDIAIKSIKKVSSTFDSRFDATARTYTYTISEKPLSIGYHHITVYHKTLDLDRLNAYAKTLLGEHDFTSYSKTNSSVEHYKSIVYKAEWKRKQGYVVFEISAIRFLRGMVRAIVGMCLNYEKNGKSVSEFEKILESKDRSNARFHAPSEGLVLEKVSYKKR